MMIQSFGLTLRQKVGTPGKGEQDFVEASVKNIKQFKGRWLGIYTEGCIHNDK
jgi:hypothetical protein